MPKPNLSSASLDALLKLRDEIAEVLTHRAALLREELSKLGQQIGSKGKAGRSSLKGRKVAVKYRDRSGNTWAGRGAQPVWLREKLKAGAKLEDFAVHKSPKSEQGNAPRSRRRTLVGRLSGSICSTCEEEKMNMVRRQFLHLADAATALFAAPYVVRAQGQAPKIGLIRITARPAIRRTARVFPAALRRAQR